MCVCLVIIVVEHQLLEDRVGLWPCRFLRAVDDDDDVGDAIYEACMYVYTLSKMFTSKSWNCLEHNHILYDHDGRSLYCVPW